MPGIFHIPEYGLPYKIERITKVDLKSVMLFGILNHLDEIGSDILKDHCLVARMLKACKGAAHDMLLISDTCFC